jgi:hypothetical protein
MKRIKSFKLFESLKENIDIQKVCDLYEDVKSIEYILEEKGIYPSYRLRVVCIPDETLQKEIRVFRVRSCEEIRGFLNRSTVVLREFFIHIENWVERDPRNRWSPVNQIMNRDDFKIEVDKYYDLLKEHLDYVGEEHITFKGYTPPQHYEILISKDYFNFSL